MLETTDNNADLKTKIINIFKVIHKCGKKMKTAAKFIDFFIHDVLDYSILNNQTNNFSKKKEYFNIKEAIETVFEMVEDKSEMKKIKICTKIEDP